MFSYAVKLTALSLFLTTSLSLVSCGGSGTEPESSKLTYNREAPIPPQCYKKTDSVYNPCYTCHQGYDDDRSNKMDDGDLQGDYNFSWLGVSNHWTNLFKDRTAEIAKISDAEIIDYIAEDNYTPLKIRLALDAEWQGYVPDLNNYQNAAAAFDSNGMALDGSGWVAFNYKPLPSTFWPTNGSTDDVLIRLPEAFRKTSCGTPGYSRDVYFTNLALVEADIMGLESITVPSIDENEVCLDLNNDGVLSTISEITAMPDHYVGEANSVSRHKTLYPPGTEFLHSVRYVGVTEASHIYTPPRMKELRYMKKTHFFNAGELAGQYQLEEIAKEDEIIPTYTNTGSGLMNSFGWLVLGFIEDSNGELRQQSHEENKFCMGCHSTIGTTIDQTFAFPRKVTGAGGWGYINTRGMPDVPNYGETEGEILTYLKRVGGGNEFRNNPEMQQRWFNEDGSVKEEKVKDADVYALITPSRDRALTLNKAYKIIVNEQSFIYGRDAVVTPPEHVYNKVPVENPPLSVEHRHQWDIRMHW